MTGSQVRVLFAAPAFLIRNRSEASPGAAHVRPNGLRDLSHITIFWTVLVSPHQTRETHMRKFILIAAMVLVSASAQAGPSRSLTLASNDGTATVEKAK